MSFADSFQKHIQSFFAANAADIVDFFNSKKGKTVTVEDFLKEFSIENGKGKKVFDEPITPSKKAPAARERKTKSSDPLTDEFRCIHVKKGDVRCDSSKQKDSEGKVKSPFCKSCSVYKKSENTLKYMIEKGIPFNHPNPIDIEKKDDKKPANFDKPSLSKKGKSESSGKSVKTDGVKSNSEGGFILGDGYVFKQIEDGEVCVGYSKTNEFDDVSTKFSESQAKYCDKMGYNCVDIIVNSVKKDTQPRKPRKVKEDSDAEDSE